MTLYETLRTLLLVEVSVAFLLYAWIYFDAWRHRGWPERLARFGVGGIVFTVAASQIKFLIEPYPFGWPPTAVMAFASVSIVGQVWMIRRPEHRR